MKNENTPRLETPRLILRRFQPGDEDAILEIYSEKETNTFLPWYPMTARQEAEKKLAGYLKGYGQPFGCQYAITLRGEDHPIGYITWGRGIAGTSAMPSAGHTGDRDWSPRGQKRCSGGLKPPACPMSPPPTTGRTPAADG